MSVANAWASAHALSMVMWFNHQIVVGQCLVIDTNNLKTFILFKLLMLSDVLMLHIQLVILLCCHSVLLIYVIHLFFFISKAVDNFFRICPITVC